MTCQFCGKQANDVHALTFESAPVRARGGVYPGLTWVEQACTPAGGARIQKVVGDGGRLVAG